MDFLYLVLGIAGLLIGTELTIGSALAIAKKHHLSEFFVGLIVLSIGSDLPEIAVAIDAGMKGLMGQDASGVVVGSSVGSVVAQIGFVLGVAGLLSYLTLPRRYIVRHGAVLLGSTVFLFLAAVDGLVSRAEALTLITFYIIYLVVLLSREKVPEEVQVTVSDEPDRPWLKLIVGLVLVIASSELTVSSVVSIAEELHINQAVISVLIIGLGTSLPELSISLAAILRKRVHLSVGNIIGSNIFDTLIPISAAALLSPVLFDRELILFDLPFAFILTAVVLLLFVRKKGLQRGEAALVLALYLFYVGVKLTQLQ
ncbi:MAG: sodium:calcium antiporter [Xanthomonadales bacterium]|nr:sodium:calcium antiporter [Xanthomonadales bacterium]NNL95315.1 sodium:calcium antiporter [Xanthomonadales bacterium]